MKRISFSLLLFASLLLTVSCNNNNEEEAAAARRTQDSLQNIIDSKDGEIDALFEMLNQIEDNLAMISAKYGAVQQLRQKGVEGNYQVKGEITTQIANIESMLEANKKRISELNAKLSTLGNQNAELQQFVSKLEARVAEQETQISSLMSELEQNKIVISNLNKNVSDLTASNQEKDNTIAQQVAEANKAYFIVGTYDQLKEVGVVGKSGGFIGIGKKQATLSDMPLDKFVQIDRTKVTTVAVNLRNAVVISKHPESSYELVPDDNDEKVIAYLRILNPSLFWQQTKYLVISTK